MDQPGCAALLATDVEEFGPCCKLFLIVGLHTPDAHKNTVESPWKVSHVELGECNCSLCDTSAQKHPSIFLYMEAKP